MPIPGTSDRLLDTMSRASKDVHSRRGSPGLRRRAWLSLALATVPWLAGCGLIERGTSCAAGDGLVAGGYRGDQMPGKTLAFVFDGGPGIGTEPSAEVLNAYRVQAAFFVQGDEAVSRLTTLAALKAQGHLIANRTFSGAPLSQARDPVSEVRKTDETIAPFVSGNAFLLRAPDGVLGEATLARLKGSGLGRYVGPIVADFGDGAPETADAACWREGQSVETCAQRYLDGVRAADRGIIAFAARHENGAAMLKILLSKLSEEGFSFVRLDQIGKIRVALTASGATPGTVGGDGGCEEYGP